MRLFSEKARGNPKRLAAELMAGLLVVAVVAAILFPILAGGHTGNHNSCLSHLKQLSTSVAIYEADNEEKVPPYFTFDGHEKATQFMAVTANYAKDPTIYRCSKDQGSTQDWSEGLDKKMSYVHCLALKGLIPNFSKGERVLKVRDDDPANSKIPYMRDPIRGYGPNRETNTVGFIGPHAGVNVAYLDCHVRARFQIDINTEL